MERLTVRINGFAHPVVEGDYTPLTYHRPVYVKIIDRLAYYEDMEEQGRLVVLPCKVGDVVYTIENTEIVDWRISYIGLRPCNSGYANLYNLKNQHIVSVAFNDIGKTVFLTREEAEQALKGGAN